MGEIIFAETRHHYDSYDDFWTLVRCSGYPTVFVDEIDMDSDNLYITTPMNGDYRAHIANHPQSSRRCTIFHWLLERPDDNFVSFRRSNKALEEDGLVDLTICSDPLMARLGKLHYVPMGSHFGLGTPGSPGEKRYHVIPLASYTPRRAFLFRGPETLHEEWEGMRIAPNGWGEERDLLLKQSLVGLNIHKDEFSFCEPIRLALFIAYGLPIVSETCEPESRTFYSPAFGSVPLYQMANSARYILQYRTDFVWLAEDRRKEFCEGDKRFDRLLGKYL